MACSGAITSIVMTAAGSFIANGGLSEVFGSAPISSELASGSFNFSTTIFGDSSFSSLSDTVAGAVGTTNTSWFGELSTTLGSMKESVIEFTAPMRDAWNTISTAPVAAGNEVFLSTVGTYGPKTAQFLSTVSTTAFNTALQQGITWAGQTIGGSGTLVASTLIGDPKKLGSIFSAAQSYTDTSNGYINAAKNGQNYLEKTFTSLDNTITAGITGVSNWADGLGDDIANLGETISWENLKNLGSPGQLMANLENTGNLGPMYEKLGNITVDTKTAQELGYRAITSAYSVATGARDNIRLTDVVRLSDLGVDLNTIARQGANLPPTLQKEIYNTLGTLTSTEVSQVKSLLNNTQQAVTQGQDLLNPQKLFNKSFTTLTTPIRTASVGFRAIYENNTGSVNPELEFLGDDLKGIVPDDIAVTNGALSRSFLQIKGIQDTSTDRLAEAVTSMENLKDLPDLQTQQQYVTPGVIEFWENFYGSDYDIQLNTGNNNSMVLCDIIGWAGGYNSGKPINDNNPLYDNLEAQGAFDEFTQNQGIYETIQEFTLGTFGPVNVAPDPMVDPPEWEVEIPAGWAAAGVYGPFATSIEAFEDAWLNGIIPYTALANVDIYNNYSPAQTVYNNEITWQDQLGREYLNRQRMDLNVQDIQPSNNVAMSFAESLSTYGTQTYFGGPAMWLERVSNLNSLGGQSVIAAMREGRNAKRLSSAGLQQDGPINTEGLQYPGELAPNQYDEQEANDLVIRT
jgi:hypothetical protein